MRYIFAALALVALAFGGCDPALSALPDSLDDWCRSTDGADFMMRSINKQLRDRHPHTVEEVIDIENVTAAAPIGLCHFTAVVIEPEGTIRVPGIFSLKKAANGKPIMSWTPDPPTH